MAPTMWCFVHFDLQMCFAPQPRAIFEHRNFQNGSDNEVFCAFSLANVLRATAACHFSPVCQNSYLRTRRFSEATFRTSGTTNHWKNAAIRDVPNIFHTCTFFQVTLHACASPWSWLDICCVCWHLYSAFQLCILSEVRLLNFLRWYTYISYVSYVYYITFLWISKHPQQKNQPFSYFFVAPFCPTQKTSSKIRRFRGLLPRLVPSARPRNWNNKSKRRKNRRPWLRWIVGRRGGWDGDGDGWVDCL